MNNKPVAWMRESDKDCVSDIAKNELLEEEGKDWNYVIPLYTHPVKELHLSLQKNKETGELLAVTYTDDEHRIVEVLWEKPPVKELTDEEILNLAYELTEDKKARIVRFARSILRKAQEK